MIFKTSGGNVSAFGRTSGQREIFANTCLNKIWNLFSIGKSGLLQTAIQQLQELETALAVASDRQATFNTLIADMSPKMKVLATGIYEV